MTDYSTFLSNSVNSSNPIYSSANNNSNSSSSVNIFGIASNDFQAFTNSSQHHLIYNQNQSVYNQLGSNVDPFAQHNTHHHHIHNQMPLANSYKNVSYVGGGSVGGMPNSWKNFNMQNSVSSASSSPHIESCSSTQLNNASLQSSQPSNYNSG